MPQTIMVSTLAELNAALSSAKGGETLLLQGGDYDKLSLSKVDFPDTVTIASADAGNPAVFSGLSALQISNLTFDGVVFDYTFTPGDLMRVRPFKVRDSQNVTIRNSVFDGDMAQGMSDIDDGYGTGYALSVRGSSNITIENNEVFNFARGMILSDITGLTVTGNNVHDMSSDGMNFAQVQNVLIEGNFIHDFLRSPDSGAHPDMIQFWTNGTKEPSGNIIIRNNHLDIGDGAWTQSIFMRNEMVDAYGAGQEMYYYNILIEDNMIANSHLHGITVGETNGLVIRNNTLVHAAGRDAGDPVSGINLPAIRLSSSSKDVTVTDNIATNIAGYDGQSGWTVEGNLILKPADYDGAFVTSTIYPNDGIHDFRAIEGGIIDLSGVGASETRDTQPSALTAQFNAIKDGQSLSTWTFDASSTLNGGTDFPDGTAFLWDFGDGSTASGRVVSHSYADAGQYRAELTVLLPDGSRASIGQPVTADSHDILRMDSGTGFTAFRQDGETLLDTGAVAAGGLPTGSSGTAASVGSQYVAPLIGSDSFGIDLTLAATSARSAGEVFRIHTSLITSVDSKGEFSVQAFTSGGQVNLKTSGAGLNDLARHDIGLTLSEGVLSVTVDGAVLATANMPAPLAGGGRSLDFGNPWGQSNFDGVISAFSIDRGNVALPDAPQTEVLDQAHALGEGALPPDPLVKPPTEDTTIPPTSSEPDSSDSDDAPQITPDPDDSTLPPADDLGDTDPGQTDHGNISDPGPTQQALLDLGAPGVVFAIARSDVAAMLESDAFSLSLGLQADSAGSAGEVLRLHQSIVTSVDAKGEFSVQAFTSEGQVNLKTSGADLADLAQHEVGLSLADGILAITIDGAVSATTAMAETLLSEGRHDLTFGNPWGKANFDGTLTAFDARFPDNDGQGGWTSVSLGHDPAARSGADPLRVAVREVEPPSIDLTVEQPIPLDLGASGTAFSVARSDVAGMLESDAFSLSLGLQADSAGSAGELFRLHQSIITSVDAKGEFSVQAFTSTGQVKLKTSGADLADLAQHEVGLSLADGILAITIDGAVSATTAMAGTLLSEGRHDLTFGNPWGKANFDGTLTAFNARFPDNDGQGGWTSVSLGHDPAAQSGADPLRVAVREVEPTASNEVITLAAIMDSPMEALLAAGYYDPGPDAAHFLTDWPGDGIGDAGQPIGVDRFAFLAEADASIPYV